jgi:hypothetical protein
MRFLFWQGDEIQTCVKSPQKGSVSVHRLEQIDHTRSKDDLASKLAGVISLLKMGKSSFEQLNPTKRQVVLALLVVKT